MEIINNNSSTKEKKDNRKKYNDLLLFRVGWKKIEKNNILKILTVMYILITIFLWNNKHILINYFLPDKTVTFYNEILLAYNIAVTLVLWVVFPIAFIVMIGIPKGVEEREIYDLFMNNGFVNKGRTAPYDN